MRRIKSHIAPVKNWHRYHSFLAVFAIIGMILGPMTVPSGGAAMAAETMSAIPDDMACCPQELSANPDCQKTCPLMITCMAKCVSGPLFLSMVIIPVYVNQKRARFANDLVDSLLGEEPPARPPRT